MPSDFPWQVILMGPENWTEWLNQLKIYAMSSGADQYLQNTATGADPFNDLRPPATPVGLQIILQCVDTLTNLMIIRIS